MATDQKYLSKQKAARRLDVCDKTIDRLRAKGDLDWIKVGTCVRILMASLEAYEQREQGGREQPERSKRKRPPIPALDALKAAKAAARRSAGRKAAPRTLGEAA
jgi:hypothetical protein